MFFQKFSWTGSVIISILHGFPFKRQLSPAPCPYLPMRQPKAVDGAGHLDSLDSFRGPPVLKATTKTLPEKGMLAWKQIPNALPIVYRKVNLSLIYLITLEGHNSPVGTELRSILASALSWWQEWISFCSHPSSMLPVKRVFRARPFALSQTPTGMHASLSILMLICLKMDEATVLLSGSELFPVQN